MGRNRAFALLVVTVMSACGGSPRRLLSVGITPSQTTAQNGNPVRFILDGTFSSEPVSQTVPANWSIQPDARLLPGDVRIDGNGVATCRIGLGLSVTVQADPIEPISGENLDNPTVATATLRCP